MTDNQQCDHSGIGMCRACLENRRDYIERYAQRAVLHLNNQAEPKFVEMCEWTARSTAAHDWDGAQAHVHR